MAELHNKITDIFSDKLNLEVPSIETDLFEDGLIDSLALVELLFALEHEFGMHISIENLAIENFKSIKKIAEFVVNQNASDKSWQAVPCKEQNF